MSIQDQRTCVGRLCNPGAIILLLILLPFAAFLFDAAGRHLVRAVVERIYASPALTQENATVYYKFVKLVEAHPDHATVFLNMWGHLSIDQTSYYFGAPHTLRDVEQEKGFSKDDVAELVGLSNAFRRVGCAYAEKRGEYVAFTSRRNYMLPTRAGVLYCLDGRNPNNVDDVFLNANKPFLRIRDNWYASRQLVTSPFRKIETKWALPDSVIDRVLRDPGLRHIGE